MAKSKKKPSLRQFTVEELQAEIERRQGPPKSNGWYFFRDIDGEEETAEDRLDNMKYLKIKVNGYCRFMLAHKRAWHMEHGIADISISHYLDLPDFVDECQESTFQAYEPWEKVRQALIEYGYEELDAKFDWGSSLRTHMIKIKGKKHLYRVSIIADTAEIHKKVDEWCDRHTSFVFASVNSYIEIITGWAEANKCVCIIYGEYGDLKSGGGCHAAIMSKKTYDSLPLEFVFH